MPEGEQDLQEESETMSMIESIVKQFANPNYVKPSARVMTPRATPKPDEREADGRNGQEDTEMKDVSGEVHVDERQETEVMQVED